MTLLEVEDLVVQFYTDGGVIRAVDGVSYEIDHGEIVGLVGESGAGKSVTCLALMGLLAKNGEIVDGSIRFAGRELTTLSDEERRRLRGEEIAMVFQDSETAFNPVYTVGNQITEAICVHRDWTKAAARERSIDLLERVGIPGAGDAYDRYPHELSGGQRQRALIAMAISCEPALLLADEPTTGVDVTIQQQLVGVLEELAAEFDTAIQFVSHDLGVVAGLCNRVLVMYAGQLVERAPVEALYYEPAHPYTAGLLASIPRLGDDRDRLPTIPGSMASPLTQPTGCRFHPRCPYAEEVCKTEQPTAQPVTAPSHSVTGAHTAACHAYTGELEGELTFDVQVESEAPARTESTDE